MLLNCFFADYFNFFVCFFNRFPFVLISFATFKQILKTDAVSAQQFRGALSSRRQFLTTERPLKMMKNIFCFILKTILVLEIFKFLS